MSDNALFAFGIAVVAAILILFVVGINWFDVNRQTIYVNAVNKCVEAGNTPGDCRIALERRYER